MCTNENNYIFYVNISFFCSPPFFFRKKKIIYIYNLISSQYLKYIYFVYLFCVKNKISCISSSHK